MAQGILYQVNNDGKITLLMQKQDTLKTLIKWKLQKLRKAPMLLGLLLREAQIQFHNSCEAMIQSLQTSNSNVSLLDVDHTLLDIPSAWILIHKRAHEDKVMSLLSMLLRGL